MKFERDGKQVSLSWLFMLALNVAGVIFAFSSGVVDRLLGYYVWHWDAKRCYEFLMIAVPIVNIIYLWLFSNDSSLIGMWLKRKRLEEKMRLEELQHKQK